MLLAGNAVVPLCHTQCMVNRFFLPGNLLGLENHFTSLTLPKKPVASLLKPLSYVTSLDILGGRKAAGSTKRDGTPREGKDDAH